jgi:ankyrin repeat protein
MLSIIFNDPEFSMKLVDKGWDVNYVSDGYETPLQIAIENQNLSLIKYFIDRGAKFDFNEIRHNLGMSDIFTISAQKNKEYNKEFWKYVTENKLYKNYSDEFGNSIIFYTSNEDKNYRNEVIINIDNKFKDKEWLEYEEIPNADQVSEIFKLLSKDLDKAKKYIIKNKINLNTKIVLNKPVFRVNRTNIDEGPNYYAIPLLVYWVNSNLVSFSKVEVDEFKKVFKNFVELGFDVNTTDTQISNFYNFNSVGNRNVLLTVLDKIKLLSDESRVNAFSLVEFMLINGSNMNSLDKNHNSVLDYLNELQDCDLAVKLYNELVIKGAKTGYEQLCFVGLPILHKIQVKNNYKTCITPLTEDKLNTPLVLRKELSSSIESKYKLYTPKLLNEVQEEILDLVSESKDDELLKRIKNGADVSFCFDQNVNVLILSIVFGNIKTALYLINDGFPIHEKTSYELTGENILDGQIKPGFTALSLAEILKNQEVIKLIKKKMK